MDDSGTIKENVDDYIDTKIDIIKMKAISKGASAVSGTITGIASFILAMFVLLFLSMSAAFAIAEITGRNSLGFLAIAGFYSLLAVFLILMKEKLITMPILNALMKKYYYRAEESR